MMILRFEAVDVDGLKVSYRSGGNPVAPAVLLLHGFPSASHMVRDLIPELAGTYRVAAPDLPGFGMTEQPARDAFAYTFENLAEVIGRFTEGLGLARFAICVFDYGVPVGFRLALAHPERVSAIVSPFFVPPDAEVFRRDTPDAEVRFVDTGHFALETHAREIGAAMRDFLAKHLH